MKLFYRPLRYIPVILVMGILFFLSHQSGPSLPLPPLPGLDKLMHGIAYAVLGAAALFSFLPETRRRQAHPVGFGVVLFCMVYGLTDEFHQSFVPGRIASYGDFLADTAGAILIVLSWLHFAGSGRKETA